MTPETKWRAYPQTAAAVLSIVAVVLTFFFVRERRDWEQSARITAVENRGESAILAAAQRMERMESFMGSLRDQVNFLERKIDRLEAHDALQDQNKKGTYE